MKKNYWKQKKKRKGKRKERKIGNWNIVFKKEKKKERKKERTNESKVDRLLNAWEKNQEKIKNEWEWEGGRNERNESEK